MVAWQVHRDAVQALPDDPATAGRVLTNPHTGTLPLDRAIDQFSTADGFLHTRDLARATRQDQRLDPDTCAELPADTEPLQEAIRSSGQYGPKVKVPGDADPQTTLPGFTGRDPR